MNTTDRDVRLSKSHMLYLRNAGDMPASLARLLESARQISDDEHMILVPHDIAEEIRSAFTDRLAKVGFDADYEPTSEGRMLEELIDRFHLV